MPAMTPPVIIILAAGKGERFRAGGAATHKLDALLHGKPVLAHVLAAARASGLPWHLVRPQGGTGGMGESIALGVKATPDAAGWLILPGDLPLISAASLCRVAQRLMKNLSWCRTTSNATATRSGSGVSISLRLSSSPATRALNPLCRRRGRAAMCWRLP